MHLLRGDPRFCFLELGPALLVLGTRGVVLVAILLSARQVAFKLAAIDFHLIQRAALFGIVLAAEDLAGPDHLSFAAAKLDQPATLQRHHLGPALGLDDACSVNRFGNRRDVRDAGGHQRRIKEAGIGIIASACGGDGHNPGRDEMMQFHWCVPLNQKPKRLRRPGGTWSIKSRVSSLFAFFTGGADVTLGGAG